MIVHKKDGWHLYSSDGSKHLYGPKPTRDLVLKRERQIQFFKRNKMKKHASLRFLHIPLNSLRT
jgi:hypothetical protein